MTTLLPTTGIIDHAPSASELQRGSSKVMLPGSLDRVPAHYLKGRETEQSPDVVLAGILRSLGSELNFGNPERFPETIENAYSIARSIGDAVIGKESPAARTLLDGTRPFGITTVTSTEGIASVHEYTEDGLSNRPVLSANMDNYFGASEEQKKLRANFTTLAVEVKPEDIGLISFLKNISHEAGHLVQFGVGGHMDTAHSAGKNGYDHMSSITLQLHPEVATTPNHYTSVRIHDERFAEGYSNVVMKEAIRVLGYSEQDSAKILRAIGFQEQPSETRRYLTEVTPEKSLGDVAKEQGVTLYEGDLGYGIPLSLNEVVADLEIANHFMTGEDLDDESFVRRYSQQSASSSREETVEVAVAPKGKERRAKRFGAHIMAKFGSIVRGRNSKTAA